MSVENLIYSIVGAIVGIAFFIIFMWINMLNKEIRIMQNKIVNFPTPEQFAKELMKVKLPPSEMPEEAILNMKEMMEDELKKIKKTKKADGERSSYIN